MLHIWGSPPSNTATNTESNHVATNTAPTAAWAKSKANGQSAATASEDCPTGSHERHSRLPRWRCHGGQSAVRALR
uniref:Uncharacterized protein n=1 Tax=Oryza barthii TaxID=65489 RepID=A0A0D3EPV6_9ORYZ